MSVESAQKDVASRQREIARLQKEKGREAERASGAAKKAAAATSAAARTSSASTAQSKLRDARRYHEEAASRQQRVASYESKLAAEHRRLVDAQKRLGDEQERLARRQLSAQQKAAREHERQLRSISGELDDHSQFQERIRNVVEKLELLPDRITVIFFALDPRDQTELLLGEEVRAIADTIRRSEHRDAVRLESRWAVRPLDLLQTINERRPEVVHFSGHGSQRDELLFQDDVGATKTVSKQAIVQLMAATSGHIKLVFFNACYTRAQAEAVVKHVPAAIGMNTAIGDDAARVFSAAFYSAIGFGLSVRKAFEQAKVALMLEGIPEDSIPELFLAQGVDGDALVLVTAKAVVDTPSSVPEAVVATQIMTRRVDVTLSLVGSANALAHAMHHLLSTSRQAALVVPVHGYVNSVKTSLSAALEELQRTLQAFGPHVEAMESAFPRLMQPTLHLKVFETLASTLGAEWGWQWKTRFEGFARASDPMNRLDRDPWKGLDWKKVFDGVEPDAGIVRDFVLEFSRRVDSFAEHIYSGRDPNDWWPARQSEERQRFERALESRAELLTSEQRELIPAMLDELYPDVKT